MAYSGTEVFPYSAEAVTPVTLLTIPRPGFDTTTEENACLQRLVTKALLDELHDTQDQVLLLGRMTAAERVSHFLSALATVPLYLLSGIFYPISTLPAPTRWLAYGNPLTYGADLLRFGLLGVHELPVVASAALMLVTTGLATGVAIALFDRRSRT